MNKDSRRPAKLEHLGGLLTRVSSAMGLEKRLREHTVISTWSQIVDPKLAETTRPLFIDLQRNLVVSAQDAAVAQELSLTKPQLLKVLSRLARSVGVDIQGIRVDLKHFHTPVIPEAPAEHKSLPEPSQNDIESVELDAAGQAFLQQLSIDLADHKLADRVIASARRRLAIAQWRRSHGYPICVECQTPAARLHEGKTCFTCYISS